MKRNKFCAILSLDEFDDDLKPLTSERPIAGLPFDCRYRLIDFPLSSIANAGINTVAMFLAGSGRSIYDHIRSGREWDLDSLHGGIFTFSQMDLKDKFNKDSNGKTDYYNNYIDFLKKSKSEFVVVMGSRMLCNLDLNSVLQHHVHKDSQITAVYKSVKPSQLHPENDHVLILSEKGDVSSILKAGQNHTQKEKEALSMEIYLLRTAILIDILQDANERGQTDHLSVLLHQSISQISTHAFEYTGYLRNICSIKSYYDANMGMLEEKNFNSLFHGNQKIYTKVKNEVPSFYSKSSNVKKSQVATGCYIEGEVEHSLLFRHVTIGHGALVKDSIIMQGGRIGPGAELDYVILDKGVVIGPNVVLKGTLENPLVIKKGQKIFNQEGVLTS